ncbi:PHA/PHB synthase family protein [Neptunomonas japonica]|uniref:PHA/PHB synthase family protein n=1 Tax=Neptunomonas japonica TaxID=417574 RepID=UPI0004122B81|nr:alpha/beta fold hydrolase [Neptunomonas japonica]
MTDKKLTINSAPNLAKQDIESGYVSATALDNVFKANMAKFTGGISPAGLLSLYFTWASHLALSPGKQASLAEKMCRKAFRLSKSSPSMMQKDSLPCIDPLPQDKRFSDPSWQQWPYNYIYQNFLFTQQWWHNATTDIDGLSKADERSISFIARQMLDRYSPSNIPILNPEVIQKTKKEAGANLISGFKNYLEDMGRHLAGELPAGASNYIPGESVAITAGKVVFRNHLLELIQYTPVTDQVYPEPVLFVPAWIMKYYILDLSSHNSMVKYLVENGHTVFMISWLNPTTKDRDLDMESYREEGVMVAIDEVSAIFPQQKIHATGYCLGGTLLSIAAATMAREGDSRLKSMTHFATQVDFSEAGELMIFTNESEISYLEKMMWDQGVLDGSQMAGAFQILHSNDLIWSRMVHHYLLGEPESMNDLMAWNTDLTRMPYKMHSQYLRKLFLNNELASGQYLVKNKPIAIRDIHVPIFSVGTEKDHVAPWRSVYKLHLQSDSEAVTFVLTSGGHNAGIVSEPGHKHRHYRISTEYDNDCYTDPDSWMADNELHIGSWWPQWKGWLKEHSGELIKAQPIGKSICDAPGTYIHQK